jgi:hypothetical protein
MNAGCLIFGLAFGLTLSAAATPERKLPAAVRAPAKRPIERLMKMSPQERERALQNLPPERRANIERRLNEIQKLPTAQQNRISARQQMLNSLPPERQAEVRRSVRQFVNMPEQRRAVINEELNHIAPLPEQEREAYLKSDEFRARYSAKEQQMLSHLAEITPQPE